MEGSQAVFCLDARATKIIDRLEDAMRQLVPSGGAGGNALSNPIEMSDIFAADGRERSGVFFHGVETLCPRIYSIHDRVIDLPE